MALMHYPVEASLARSTRHLSRRRRAGTMKVFAMEHSETEPNSTWSGNGGPASHWQAKTEQVYYCK